MAGTMTRHPQAMIAEAQEVYYLQTCLFVEMKSGERCFDDHAIAAFFVLEQIYCDLMRDAQTLIDAKSSNQPAES